MKRKFTFLIAAAFMLLTMMASTATALGQTRSDATLNIKDYATANNWQNGTQYKTASVSPVTFTATGGGNTGKYYTSGNEWRFYQTESASITISVSNNYTLSSIAFTYNSQNSGVLKNGNSTIISGSAVTVSGTSATFTVGNSGSATNGQVKFTNIVVTYATAGSNIVATPTFTPNGGSFLESQEISIACATDGATIYYTIDGSTPTSSSTEYSNPFTINATTTIKAIGIKESYDDSEIATATFTKATVMTVAEARDYIDGLNGATSTEDVYVEGIISQIDGYNSQYHSITYWISDDGTTTDQMEVYSGKGLNGADFNAISDLTLNSTVIVKGKVKLYNTTYEFTQSSQIISLTPPATPYITAEDVNITYDATAGSIAYTIQNQVQGGQLTAATTSDWLTLSNNLASPIAFTCSANNAANSRTATVTLTYTYGTKTTVAKDVTVTQAGNPDFVNNITDITTIGANYKVRGTVVAINSKGFVMGDGTGYVYYYKGSAVTQTVNSKYTFEGKTGSYGNVIQFINSPEPTITASETSNYDGNPAATVITAVPDYSTGYHLSTYLEFEGALTKSNSNYFITLGESQIQISYPTTEQGNALTALNGKTVHVKGYFTGINSSSKFTVMLESAVEVAAPSITLEQYEYNISADGGDNGLPVTYTNMPADPQAEVIFYEANGTTTATYDWITASINASYNIDGHIDTNTGEARSAYFKVKGIDANNNEVYSDLITINQAAPAEPSITVNTTSFNIAAGGGQQTTGFSYSNLGSGNPTFSVQFYAATGEPVEPSTYGWLTAEISTSDGTKVNITVSENTGEARTAYFKIHGVNGEKSADSQLVTVNQAANVVDYAILPFGYGGGVLSDFSSLNGTSYSLNDNGSYNETHAPYRIKFTKTGDYLQVKTNERPGIVTIGVKMVGGGTTSTITVQGSADGETFTNIQTLEISGSQNDIVNLATTNNFAGTDRYVRLYFTKGSNVGVGPITIAQFDDTPSITVNPATLNVNSDGEDGELTVTYHNITTIVADVYFCSATGDPATYDWIQSEINTDNNVDYVIGNNTGETRTAYLKVYALDDNSNYVYSNLVTITQAAPIQTFDVTFDVAGGEFVPNSDFPDYAVEKQAGTYNLPSATKAGSTFAGWSDGGTVYAADAEYTVSANVDFVAQWITGTQATITFGNSGTKINDAEVTGDDNLGNTWTITTVGTSSFTQQATYSQVGSSSSPATNITFTTTLAQETTFTAFSAKFGGFSGTAGTVTLKVDDTTVGSGSLNGTSDVNIENTTSATGTVLTITVTGIAKGVKCYYISYTISTGSDPIIIAQNSIELSSTDTYGEFDYSIVNPASGVNLTASSTDEWISNINVTAEKVTFNTTQNTSATDDREGTITLSYTGAANKVVTVTQSRVDYAPMPFAFDGGRTDIETTMGLTQEGLDSDYGSSPKLKFNTTGDWVVLKLNAAPASLSYDLKGNSVTSDGGTFTVQTSTDGQTYEDLVVHSTLSLNDVVTSFTFIDLASDVRYIKWIYTNKSNGNVGLGNIHATEHYDTYGNVTFSNLDLTTSSQSLIIHDGSVVTVTGTLTNNSPDNLVIKDGGQLYHNNSVAASMEKTIEGVTNWHNENDHGGGWYLLSSPIGMQSAYGLETVVNLAPEAVAGVPQFDLFTYNEPNVQWMNFNHNSYAVYKGQGFLYARHEGATLKFSGTLPVANTELSPSSNPKLEYTEANGDMAGWNLIGNPYSHNITWNNFTSTGDINTSGYYRMVDGAWITEASKTAEIKPMEGFLVKATGDNPYIMIKNTPSSKDNTDNDFVEFIVNSANHYDVTYAMFSEGEGLEKISHRNTDIPMVYIPKDGERYAIATMGDNTEAFNLNFKAMTTGQYTLKMKANSEYSYLHVIDRLTGEDVDMLLNGEYTFIGSPRDDENRFIVRLNANSNFGADNDIFAYQNGSEIIVSGEGELQIFDVMGRFVMSRTINGNESINTATFNTGVYVLRMVGETVKTQKIVVK